MNNRELLEMAAKSADMKCVWSDEYNTMYFPGLESMGVWNPIDSDGDAFRLLCALGMALAVQYGEISVGSNYKYGIIVTERFEDYQNDKHAATRLAIVKCAAEIGRAM